MVANWTADNNSRFWADSCLGFLFFLLFMLVCSTSGLAMSMEDYFSMSLEELMDIEISSAAKRPQKLKDVPFAVYVITQEDLKRTGVRYIADALRMVPGLHVAQAYAKRWAVSARGFNDEYANKLLLLIDGRSVYSAAFPTVLWDEQTIPIELIERIEVIRGPGGATWGANAVNGIINVIIKRADATQGLSLTAGAGNEEKGFGDMICGDSIGENLFYRMYVQAIKRDNSYNKPYYVMKDGWYDYRAGFRMDGDFHGADSVTISGDVRYGERAAAYKVFSYVEPYWWKEKGDVDVKGGNLMLKWEHLFEDASQVTLKTYVQRSHRLNPILKNKVDTVDAEIQYLFYPWSSHSTTVGVGFRANKVSMQGKWFVSFRSPERNDYIYSFFFQDEASFLEDNLKVTWGARIDHNSYTHMEIQPTARILWKKNEKNIFWAAVSRAVHTPDLSARSANWVVGFINPSTFIPLSTYKLLKGDEDFRSEVLWAYEAGYRYFPGNKWKFDLSIYFDNYSNLTTITPAEGLPELVSQPVSHLESSLIVSNCLKGEVYGLELALSYSPVDWWTVKAAYTYTKMFLHPTGYIKYYDDKVQEGKTPEHQLSLFSMLKIGDNMSLDAWLRFNSNLPSIKVPSYWAMDVHLGWTPSSKWEFSLVGQNIFDNHHPEIKPMFWEQDPSEVERSFYASLTFHF